MKKILIKILFIAGVSVLTAGCSKFLDINKNPNEAEDVNEGLLLTGVETVVGYNITGGMPARMAAYWTQQVSYNVIGPDVDSYRLISLDVNNTWTFDLYPSVLKNLKIIEEKAAANGHKYYGGIAKILLAYNLAVATDLWNSIPYQDALEGLENVSPKYQTQESIYEDIAKLLDEGIALTQEADGGNVVPEDDDLIYGGDMEKWTKFGYMLKARYALRLINAPGKNRTAQANEALQALSNGFANASDVPAVPFPGTTGQQNPWSQFIAKWSGAFSSFYFVETMKSRKDPRLPVVAEPNKLGQYIGHKIGTRTLPLNRDTLSDVGSLFSADDAPIYLATYDEALFIKAEATYWTSGFAAAQPILTDAVKATMARFGLDPNSPEVTAYLAQHCVLTNANAYQVIMTEKYFSNFLSLEAFNDWRRSGFPVLQPVENAFVPTIPRRWPYATQEINSNPQPEHQGVKITDRVWWDTK